MDRCNLDNLILTIPESGKISQKAICFSNLLQSEIKSLILLQSNVIMNDINHIKVVLIDKKRTNKWLSAQLGVNPSTISI